MRRVKWHLVWLILACLLLAAQPVLADGADQVAVVGRAYVLEAGQSLRHDLAVVGGKLTLQPGSEVLGSVAVTGGNVTVAGHITGDLVVIGGSLELADSAIIDGDVVTLGSIERAAGAVVRGQVHVGIGASADLRSLSRAASLGSLVEPGHWLNGFLSLLGALLALCLIVGLTAIIAAIWPAKIRSFGTVMQANWLQCLGAGILSLLVVVILVPILVVICIGIPVAVVLLLALAIASLAGWAAISKYVGARLLETLKIKASPLVETIAGASLLTFLAFIPCLGTLMAIILGSVGVGAVLLTRFGTVCYPPSTSQGSGAGTPGTPANSSSLQALLPGEQPKTEV